jgi:predicted RNA-binding Zn ribbon-like protein
MKNFKLVGSEPSLDFVNTVGYRKSNPVAKLSRDYADLFECEYLENYADLVSWSRQAKLLTESEAKRLLLYAKNRSLQAEKIYERALVLREVLYRLFKCAMKDWKPETSDLEKLNQELSIANKHEAIDYYHSRFGWKWKVANESLDYMLWRVTQSAAEVLTSADLTRLRQCSGNNCGWMFLDTSRNRSRQWCDMKDCGNLAKVRRFRKKGR